MTALRWICLAASGLFMLATLIFMGLSRMYLGMHASNQVLFGSLMGLWTAFTALVLLWPPFEIFILNLKSKQDQSSDTVKHKLIMLIVTVVTVISILWLIIVDLTIMQPYIMNDTYKANIAKCNGASVFVYKPSKGDILLSCLAMVPVGAFVGLFFRWRMVRGWSYPLSDPVLPKSKKNCYLIVKALFKILAALMTTAPALIYAIVFTIWIDDCGTVTIIILGWILPCFINGFMFTCGL